MSVWTQKALLKLGSTQIELSANKEALNAICWMVLSMPSPVESSETAQTTETRTRLRMYVREYRMIPSSVSSLRVSPRAD